MENRLARQRQFPVNRFDVEVTISRKAETLDGAHRREDSLLLVTDINEGGGIRGDDYNSRSSLKRVRSS